MTLACTIDGNPSPFMAWIAPNGTTLLNRTSDGNFAFSSVSRDDSGPYWCDAANGVDPPKSAMVELQVLCKRFLYLNVQFPVTPAALGGN